MFLFVYFSKYAISVHLYLIKYLDILLKISLGIGLIGLNYALLYDFHVVDCRYCQVVAFVKFGFRFTTFLERQGLNSRVWVYLLCGILTIN